MFFGDKNGCMPVVVGEAEFITLSRGYALECGDMQLLYEAIISPLPAVTISAVQNALDGISCQAVLVIEKGNGEFVVEEIPQFNRDGYGNISLVAQDVRRIFIFCIEVPGGTGCSGSITFSVQYCECTNSCIKTAERARNKKATSECCKHIDNCCSCKEGKVVQIGEINHELGTGFNLQCGTETGPLFLSDLNCPTTVTILPFINQSIQQQQCMTTLLIELEDGSIIEKEITPSISPTLGSSSPPAFTIANVRQVRLRCGDGAGANCNGAIFFIASYC